MTRYLEQTNGQFRDMLEEREMQLVKERNKQIRLDNMYMEIAEVFAKQSTANRSKVGAVLVRDNNIISSGWNGTPPGFDNACETEQHGQMGAGQIIYHTKPEVLHAELNCLAKIAQSTQSSKESTMYITLSPCMDCAKLLISSGVKRVVYRDKYRDLSGIKLLQQAKIEVEQL